MVALRRTNQLLLLQRQRLLQPHTPHLRHMSSAVVGSHGDLASSRVTVPAIVPPCSLLADIGFGRALGIKTDLLRAQYWRPFDLQFQPDHLADSLQVVSENVVSVRSTETVSRLIVRGYVRTPVFVMVSE